LSDGTLAGSTTTMDSCLRHWILATGCTLEESFRLVGANPARTIGLLPKVGEMVPGKLANLTALDAELKVRLVVVRGRIAYQDGLE
jgi:N-acetylglucosamine-6-phosphate deacetylase